MYELSINDRFFLPHTGCEVDLRLISGKGYILAGENGVGKTTIIHRFFGKLNSDSVTLINQLALTFFYERTLGKFLDIFTKSAGERLERDTFHLLYKNFGLKDKSSRLLTGLSGGEGQCLKLLCGLSLKSDLYLLDEPSQYLDSEKKRSLLQILNQKKDAGKTLLLVEHDLAWIEKGWEAHKLISSEGIVKVGESWTI